MWSERRHPRNFRSCSSELTVTYAKSKKPKSATDCTSWVGCRKGSNLSIFFFRWFGWTTDRCLVLRRLWPLISVWIITPYQKTFLLRLLRKFAIGNWQPAICDHLPNLFGPAVMF